MTVSRKDTVSNNASYHFAINSRHRLPAFLLCLDPVKCDGVSQQRNGNVENRYHSICGCVAPVIQKIAFLFGERKDG